MVFIYIYIIYIYNNTSVAILPQVFVIPCLSGMYQKSDGGVVYIHPCKRVESWNAISLIVIIYYVLCVTVYGLRLYVFGKYWTLYLSDLIKLLSKLYSLAILCT